MAVFDAQWETAYLDYHCPNCCHAVPCDQQGHPWSQFFPQSERMRFERGEITEYDPRQGYTPDCFYLLSGSKFATVAVRP